MVLDIDKIPKHIKSNPEKLGALMISEKAYDLNEENKKLKALLSELWKYKNDSHWCFEMSSTIEESITNK